MRHFIIAAVLATGAIAGALAGGEWIAVHYVCKPLATLMLVVVAWRAATPVSRRYRLAVSAGLLLALGGDVCLMLPQDPFLPGLACFAMAHAGFLMAFTSDIRLAVRPLAMLASGIFGALMLWLLWPSVEPSLRGPVAIYVALVATMGGQALGRVGVRHTRDALFAAAGALCFMLSDAVLAWNRFGHAVPLAALWVLSTYYVAIACIARSVDARDVPSPQPVRT